MLSQQKIVLVEQQICCIMDIHIRGIVKMLRIIPQILIAWACIAKVVRIFLQASFIIISAYKYFLLLLFRLMFYEFWPNFAEIE